MRWSKYARCDSGGAYRDWNDFPAFTMRSRQQFKSGNAVGNVVRLKSDLYDVRGRGGESFINIEQIAGHTVKVVVRNDDTRPVGSEVIGEIAFDVPPDSLPTRRHVVPKPQSLFTRQLAMPALFGRTIGENHGTANVTYRQSEQ